MMKDWNFNDSSAYIVDKKGQREMPPTEQQTETRWEVAERIIREWYVGPEDLSSTRLVDAIEAALRDRDERAARIAEKHFCMVEPEVECNCQQQIAEAIRNEDHK